MSENKITIGFIGVLQTPLGDNQTESWEQAFNSLDNDNEGLQINYEGTLIFNHVTHVDSSDFSLLVGAPQEPEAFVDLCHTAGFSVEAETVKPYFAHWYNGCDSPMSELELAEFNEAGEA